MKQNVYIYVGKAKYMTLPFTWRGVIDEKILDQAIKEKAIKRVRMDFDYFKEEL